MPKRQTTQSVLATNVVAPRRELNRPQGNRKTSLRTRLRRGYFGAQLLGGLLIVAYAAPQLSGPIGILAVLLALNFAAERWNFSIYDDSHMSVGFALTMAIIAIFGAPGAVILAPLIALAGQVGRGKWTIFALNASLWALAYGLAGFAYDLVAVVDPANASLEMAAGAFLATVTSFGFIAVNLAIGQYLRTGERPAQFWEKHLWLAPHYAALGAVGTALAAAYLALGIPGILAFLTPAVMMRLATKQYVDKTAEHVRRLEHQNSALEKANVEIRKVSDELRVSYDSTLEALVSALDARDQETKGHSIRVARYMLDIARELGVPEGTSEWLDMQRGALLHDVGKIGVSDTILLKPGKLTDDEWVWMRKHPEIGYNMLKEVGFLKGASEIILAHHERWDGKGYPRGLAHEDIPLGARIFMVCDTFDSMTSDRPYRKALSTQQALNEILRCGGEQFDPRVVEAFLDIYETWVRERAALHAASELQAAA